LVDDLSEFARYPDSVYHGVIRSILTTILPLVLISSFPVRLLMNNFDVNLLIHQVLVLVFFGVLASVLWHFGVKHYQGASS
jgi:ABC-2 type transport system permease protein